MADRENADPPFHYEIWNGPSAAFGTKPKPIYYVENHNEQCGYSELALDFEMAANALIVSFRDDRLGNWIAPIAHLVRQTLELRLKHLLQIICEDDKAVLTNPLRGHNLVALWQSSLAWLDVKHPNMRDDARLQGTEHLLAAFHAIDPTGDLFRFGQSYQEAFSKRRSYDRVGLKLDILQEEFSAAVGFLSHWAAVIWRKKYFADQGKNDELFDANDFPRKGSI